ncbi:MAG: aldolase/citrate lyase family protein [Acidimicrobiia bacterium]|nr:aldolase/citrate lyase family protein [Acidimicrobiia bacterium]
MVRENHTKRRLAAGETVIGCFVRYPIGSLAEFMALGGWDFLVFDAEHGTLQPRDLEDLSRACELHGVTPMVRVTTNEPSTILRFLDAGAHGLHVPWVDSGAAAEKAVQAVKYQPRGSRGLAATRSAGFGIPAPIGDYVRQSNAETLVVVQVETADGVSNIEEFVSVDGVDVVFIGPTDLAHSLGHAGDPAHPEVQAAMDRITEVVTASDKTLGIFVANPTEAVAWRERGARYITTGLEPLLQRSMQDYLATVRNTGGETP